MSRSQYFASFFFCLLLALIPVAAVVAQRSAGFLPGLAGLAGCLSLLLVFHTRLTLSRHIVIGIAAFAGLALLSTLWSFDPAHVWKMPVRASLVMASGLLLIAAAQSFDVRNLKPYLWMVPASLFLAALLIVFDQKMGNPLYRALHHTPPGEHINPSQYNRATSIIVLLLLSALSILREYCNRRVIAALLICCLAPLLLVTDSQSGQMALLLAMIVFYAFPYARPKAWYALAGIVFALAMTAPFLVIWIFDHFAAALNTMPVLGQGNGYAGARLEIWDYVSRYMLQRPLTGFGFEATRFVPHFDTAQVYQKTDFILHPHNFMIQIWMEFGVIGALLTGGLLAGLILLMQKKLTRAEARVALPSMIACLSIASTGYGLWQAWWIGTLFTVAALCVLAIRLKRDSLTPAIPA
ncbi:MAG: O-Antigen polymerase family protein [Micavibrio sp.]|nr:O-Antigen polymerase family protein [Micavibrio sp.]